MGKFYKEFGLKKILECEGLEFLNDVNVGTEVYLKNDLDNKKFKGLTNQVGITKEEGKDNVIGVIPEEEGKFIKDFLDMGWNKLFKAVISQNDSTKPLENRFKVAVYIERFIDVKDDVKKEIKEIEEIEKNK